MLKTLSVNQRLLHPDGASAAAISGRANPNILPVDLAGLENADEETTNMEGLKSGVNMDYTYCLRYDISEIGYPSLFPCSCIWMGPNVAGKWWECPCKPSDRVLGNFPQWTYLTKSDLKLEIKPSGVRI